MAKPTVTSAYLRHEADARLSSDVHVWGILRAAANGLDAKDARIAELELRLAVRRVEIQPTDRLAVSCRGQVSADQALAIAEKVTEWSGLPRSRVLVLSADMHVTAVATEHQEDK